MGKTVDLMEYLKTLTLFTLTAVVEIVGCYSPYLWLKQGRSPWLLVPAALSLAFLPGSLHCIPTPPGVFMPPMVVHQCRSDVAVGSRFSPPNVD
jgi:hypothetical protein